MVRLVLVALFLAVVGLPLAAGQLFTQLPSPPWSPRILQGWAWPTQAISYTPLGSTSAVLSTANATVFAWGGSLYNDTYVSTNYGVSWTLVAGVGYSSSLTYVNAPTPASFTEDDSGACKAYDPLRNEFYVLDQTNAFVSSDAQNWQHVTSQEYYSRQSAECYTDANSRLFIVGGQNTSSNSYENDVYVSTTQGASFTFVSTAPWSQRDSQRGYGSQQPLGKVIQYAMGGHAENENVRPNEVWVSSDAGASWTLLAYAQWTGRDHFTALVTPQNVMLMVSGKLDAVNTSPAKGHLGTNDVWASLDGGATWGACSLAAGFPVRQDATLSIDPLGYLYISGGTNIQNTSTATSITLGDVWKSTISFSNPATVASTCGLSMPPNGLIGLQCWPNATTSLGIQTTSAGLTYPTFKAAPFTCAASGTATQNAATLFTQLPLPPWSPRILQGWAWPTQSISYTPLGSTTAVLSTANATVFAWGGSFYNDTYVSTNYGVSWSLVAGVGVSGTSPLTYTNAPTPASFTEDDDGACKAYDPLRNEFYVLDQTNAFVSSDAQNWQHVTSQEYYSRQSAECYTDANSRLFIVGGQNTSSNSYENDVYVSTTQGASFTFVSTAPWSQRDSQRGYGSQQPLGKVIQYAMGGHAENENVRPNEVWVSSDAGASWTLLAYAQWTGRDHFTALVTPQNVMLMVSGKLDAVNTSPAKGHLGTNDVWASLDGGATWGACSLAAGFPVRQDATLSIDPLGYLYISGGTNIQNTSTATSITLGDVWKSTISFSNPATVASTCGLSMPPNGLIGLQCWPNATTSLGIQTTSAGLTYPTFKAAPFTCAASGTATQNAATLFTQLPLPPWSPRILQGWAWPTQSISYTPLGSTTAVLSTANATVFAWGGSFYNDTYVSTNYGVSWSLVAGVGVSGTSPLTYTNAPTPASFTEDDDGACKAYDPLRNEFYVLDQTNAFVSSDAQNWQHVTSQEYYSRQSAECYTDANSRLFIVGGQNTSSNSYENDVYVSTTQGASFTFVSTAPWSQRDSQRGYGSQQPLGKVIQYAMGGHAENENVRPNEVWVSSDAGASWTLLAYAQWTGRDHFTALVTPQNVMLMVSGKLDAVNTSPAKGHLGTNDVWARSDTAVSAPAQLVPRFFPLSRPFSRTRALCPSPLCSPLPPLVWTVVRRGVPARWLRASPCARTRRCPSTLSATSTSRAAPTSRTRRRRPASRWGTCGSPPSPSPTRRLWPPPAVSRCPPTASSACSAGPMRPRPLGFRRRRPA